MSKDVRRLGRGLSSLISKEYSETIADRRGDEASASDGAPAAASLQTAPIHSIRPNPHQPRTDFEGEQHSDLVKSIRQTGILQPLLVRRSNQGWELIAGERRLRAAREAGLREVPVVVRQATDEEVLELALIENIHRQDLNAIDRARAYRRYADEFHLPADEIARRVGEDRSTVANYLRLLELSEEIQRLVAARAISMGHARCLLGVESESARQALAVLVAQKDLSVRALEEIVRRRRERASVPKASDAGRPRSRPVVQAVEEKMRERLGLRVRIREGRRPNSGRIQIEYHSLDDFNRVIDALGVQIE